MSKTKPITIEKLLTLLKNDSGDKTEVDEHLNDEQVFGYFEGSLRRSERDIIDRHTANCPACADHLIQLQQYFDTWEGEIQGRSITRRDAVPSAEGQARTPQLNPIAMRPDIESPHFSQSRRKQEMPRKSSGKKKAISPDYFSQQMRVDAREKKRLARWVLQRYPLRDNAGVVVDAGSTAFHIWKIISKRLVTRTHRNLTVMTNNFEVLSDWIKTQRSHMVLGTTVDVAGGIFHPPHRAFYGSQERKKVKSMLLSYVYIGLAGLDVDDGGRFLIGYQSEPFEVQSKQVLFQCPCEARFLLATARKIGYSGSRALDLFTIPNVNWKAPIYLVSTTPTNAREEAAFGRLKHSLLEGRVRDNLMERGIAFNWSIVDCTNDRPKLVDDVIVSPRVFEQLGTQVDQIEKVPSSASRPDSTCEDLLDPRWKEE
jgi:DeoR/GlpR family transcriptional regulator of sugar metabolism